MPKREIEAFEYVLGYVARKFVGLYPDILAPATRIDSEKDWIDIKNEGGLVRMSRKYIEKFHLVEDIFRAHHGITLIEESGAVAKLVKSASNRLGDFPNEILRFYYRCRIFFKIKILNKARFEEKNRKKVSKMKKISK